MASRRASTGRNYVRGRLQQLHSLPTSQRAGAGVQDPGEASDPGQGNGGGDGYLLSGPKPEGSAGDTMHLDYGHAAASWARGETASVQAAINRAAAEDGADALTREWDTVGARQVDSEVAGPTR